MQYLQSWLNLQRYYDRYGRWCSLDTPLPSTNNNNNNTHKVTKLQTNIIKQRKLNTKLKQQVHQLKYKYNNKHNNNNKHKKQISTSSSFFSEDLDRDIEYNSEDNDDEDISLLSDWEGFFYLFSLLLNSEFWLDNFILDIFGFCL